MQVIDFPEHGGIEGIYNLQEIRILPRLLASLKLDNQFSLFISRDFLVLLKEAQQIFTVDGVAIPGDVLEERKRAEEWM